MCTSKFESGGFRNVGWVNSRGEPLWLKTKVSVLAVLAVLARSGSAWKRLFPTAHREVLPNILRRLRRATVVTVVPCVLQRRDNDDEQLYVRSNSGHW